MPAYPSERQRRITAAKRLPLFFGVAPPPKPPRSAPVASVVVEDTLLGYEPYFSRYGISELHARGVLGAGVSIVVIDCGLSSASRALFDNVNLISLRKTQQESLGAHGIAVAALVAAKSLAATKRTGIAPESTLTLIDVDDDSGVIKLSAVLGALAHALALKPDIVNISLGTDTSDDDLQKAVAALTDSGCLVFAAAGNSGQRVYEFPGACPGVINVGSMDAEESPSTFNSRNDTVCVFAPGERINKRKVVDAFAVSSIDGTSFSSPFAAALLALHLCDMRGAKTLGASQIIGRREAVAFLRAAFRNDCQRHLYVQENFSEFGCNGMDFRGVAGIISRPTCAPQFRSALFWFSMSLLLGGILLLTLLSRSQACVDMCKVIFHK